MYTQVLALVFAVLWGVNRAVKLLPAASEAKGFVTLCWLTLTAGAVLLRFLCDQNQEHGLGDGLSLLICTSMAMSELQ